MAPLATSTTSQDPCYGRGLCSGPRQLLCHRLGPLSPGWPTIPDLSITTDYIVEDDVEAAPRASCFYRDLMSCFPRNEAGPGNRVREPPPSCRAPEEGKRTRQVQMKQSLVQCLKPTGHLPRQGTEPRLFSGPWSPLLLGGHPADSTAQAHQPPGCPGPQTSPGGCGSAGYHPGIIPRESGGKSRRMCSRRNNGHVFAI